MTNPPQALPWVIKPKAVHISIILLIFLAFLIVGIMMQLMVPPSDWLVGIPLRTAIQHIYGLVVILFAVIGLSVILFLGTKPLLQIHADKIYDCRRKLEIPFSDIKKMETVEEESLNTRWLSLYMHDPKKYAAYEKLSKDYNLNDGADLILDFSLASKEDYENIKEFILQKISKE